MLTGCKNRETKNAEDHHWCREETTSILELLEHELLGLLPRVFGVSEVTVRSSFTVHGLLQIKLADNHTRSEIEVLVNDFN